MIGMHTVRVFDPVDHLCQLRRSGRLHAVPQRRLEHYQRLLGKWKNILTTIPQSFIPFG